MMSNGARVITWRRRAKVKLVAAFGGACKRCGYNKSVAALQFHHRDSATKEFGIGGRVVSYARLLAEARKCDLLCANCHAEEHDRGGIAKTTATHGANGYRYGCRCVVCLDDIVKVKKAWRARRRAAGLPVS